MAAVRVGGKVSRRRSLQVAQHQRRRRIAQHPAPVVTSSLPVRASPARLLCDSKTTWGLGSGERRFVPHRARAVGLRQIGHEGTCGPAVEDQVAADQVHNDTLARHLHQRQRAQWRFVEREVAVAGFGAEGLECLFAVCGLSQVESSNWNGPCSDQALQWLDQVELAAKRLVARDDVLDGRLERFEIDAAFEAQAQGLVERTTSMVVIAGNQPTLGLTRRQRRHVGHAVITSRAIGTGWRTVARRDESQRHQLVQRLSEDVEDAIDFSLAHRLGDEMAKLFVQVQAVEAHQVVEEADVLLVVVPGQAPDRCAVDGFDRRATRCEGGVEPVDHALRAIVECSVELAAAALQVQQRSPRRGQRQRVAHEGAGEVGDTRFGVGVVAVLPVAAVERVEPARAATDRRERQATADDLAVGREVGTHAIKLLRTTRGDAKAGHHLVEDQRAAGFVGNAPQRLHELAWLNGWVLVLDRLRHDGRQFGAALAQDAQRVFAVPVEHQDVLDGVRQDAGCGRQGAQLLGAAHDHLVEDAVVRVGENRDRLAAGHCAGDAHGAHHGFGAGVAEGHALHAGEFGDQLRDLGRERVLRADFDAGVQLIDHRLEQRIRLVAQQVAAEARQQVDVLVAVEVPKPRALGAFDDEGVDKVFPQRVETGHDARVGHHLAVLLAEGLRLAGARVVALHKVVDPAPLLRREVLFVVECDARGGAEWFFDQGTDRRLAGLGVCRDRRSNGCGRDCC